MPKYNALKPEIPSKEIRTQSTQEYIIHSDSHLQHLGGGIAQKMPTGAGCNKTQSLVLQEKIFTGLSLSVISYLTPTTTWKSSSKDLCMYFWKLN